jgi:hypothetical protein
MTSYLKEFIVSAIANERWIYAVPGPDLDNWKDTFLFAFFTRDMSANVDFVVNRLEVLLTKNQGVHVFSISDGKDNLEEAEFYSVEKELEKIGFEIEEHLSKYHRGQCPWVPEGHDFYQSFKEKNDELYKQTKKRVTQCILTFTRLINVICNVKTRCDAFQSFLIKVFSTEENTFTFCTLMSESKESFKGFYNSMAEKVNMVRNEPGGILLENAIRHFDGIRTDGIFLETY